jgi:hypothetical protein
MAARTFFGPGNFGRRIVEHGNGAFGWRDVFHGRHRRLFASGRNAPRRDVCIAPHRQSLEAGLP